MKSAGKARNNGLYRHIRTSKKIIRNLLNDYMKNIRAVSFYQHYGFQIKNQEIEESTSEEEYTMEWHR